MFKYMKRILDDNDKKIGYLLLDLDTNEEVSFLNKELKEKFINKEIEVDGLILTDSNRVIEYDEEKEKLRSEKKQELNDLLSMEAEGESWEENKITKVIVPAKSGLLDIISALNGPQTVYVYERYLDGTLHKSSENGIEVIGQDDFNLRNKLEIEELKSDKINNNLNDESVNLSVDDILDEIENNKESKIEPVISDKFYGLEINSTANNMTFLTNAKVLLYNGELDSIDWKFFDVLRKECNVKNLGKNDFILDLDYENNIINLLYKTFPVLVHNIENRELVDIDLIDFKLYKISWIKSLKCKFIEDKVVVKYNNMHLDALLTKSYILLENEEDFYFYIDSLGLPRNWFNIREVKTYKDDEILYKQLGIGTLFRPGLFQISDDKFYIETLLY